MQQMILDSNRIRFLAEVNEHLMNGWKVVPGTMFATSIKSVATEGTPRYYVTEEGTTWHQVFSVVLENPEVT